VKPTEIVQIYSTNKNMNVMVWGIFWDNRRSNLYIMDQDFESTKHRYSAKSYLEVPDAEIALIFIELDDRYQFMQDNVSIYTTGSISE
jgi:hypothetical protein